MDVGTLGSAFVLFCTDTSGCDCESFKGMQLAHFCLANFNGFSKFLLYSLGLFRTFQMLIQHPKQKLFSNS